MIIGKKKKIRRRLSGEKREKKSRRRGRGDGSCWCGTVTKIRREMSGKRMARVEGRT